MEAESASSGRIPLLRGRPRADTGTVSGPVVSFLMSGGYPAIPDAVAPQGWVGAAMALRRSYCSSSRVSVRLSASRWLAKITASAMFLRLAGPVRRVVTRAGHAGVLAEDAVPLSMVQVFHGQAAAVQPE